LTNLSSPVSSQIVGPKDANRGFISIGLLEEPVEEVKCVECGKGVEKDWLKKINVVVPLCPVCYEKARHLFEEFESQTSEVSTRINSK